MTQPYPSPPVSSRRSSLLLLLLLINFWSTNSRNLFIHRSHESLTMMSQDWQKGGERKCEGIMRMRTGWGERRMVLLWAFAVLEIEEWSVFFTRGSSYARHNTHTQDTHTDGLSSCLLALRETRTRCLGRTVLNGTCSVERTCFPQKEKGKKDSQEAPVVVRSTLEWDNEFSFVWTVLTLHLTPTQRQSSLLLNSLLFASLPSRLVYATVSNERSERQAKTTFSSSSHSFEFQLFVSVVMREACYGRNKTRRTGAAAVASHTTKQHEERRGCGGWWL